MTRSSSRRLSAAMLAVAGVLFALYPAVRPYSDETTMDGAVAMAASAWLVAHTFAMAAFILLALTLRPVLVGLELTGRAARAVPTLGWLGVALVLPYYGAEVFGLQAIATEAIRADDPALLQLADSVRYGPVAMTSFGAGLVLLGVTGVLVAVSLRRSEPGSRIGGLAIAGGLVLYLPQFYGTPQLRIAHGVLLAIGCLMLAVGSLRRQPSATPKDTSEISAASRV